MYCLRCGREKPEKQVFCDACLDDMSRYPVKPDATVYIPSHKPTDVAKKHPKRAKRRLTPDELNKKLKAQIKRLWILILILILLLGICGVGIYYSWHHNPDLIIGQNYQTVDTGNTNQTTGGTFASSGG